MAISIQSVMHVNANCSNLERSLAFYREVVGLTPGHHTNPFPQDGAGFGMSAGAVQWDAYILQDPRGYAGPGLDLLEWKQPPPIGTPPAEPHHLGLQRLAVHVPDLEAAHARALDHGAACLGTPHEEPMPDCVKGDGRVLRILDPDGLCIELIADASLAAPQLSHVSIQCSELERSLDWYERVLGLELRERFDPGPTPGAGYGIEGEIEWHSRLLQPPGQAAFALDLRAWSRPAPVGRPNAPANHLGLYRLALLVADMQECHAVLREAIQDCPEPVYLDMGPEIPIDGLWALFFPDPDGTCLELIESPRLEGGATR